MRHRLTTGMAAICVTAALAAAWQSALHSEEPLGQKAAAPALRIKQQEFEGVSDRRSYDEALADALAKMDKAVADEGRYPCTSVTWRVIDVSGKSGSPAGLNELRVKIAASFERKDPDPLGTWKVTRRSSDTEMAGFTLTVKRENDKLVGTAVWPDGKTETSPVQLKDEFFTIRLKPGNVIHQYSGRLSGDTLEGKWAAGIGVFGWQARREPHAKPSE
jgi:hypothetical protein